MTDLDLARRQLIARIARARDENKSVDEVMRVANGFLDSQPKKVAQSLRGGLRSMVEFSAMQGLISRSVAGKAPAPDKAKKEKAKSFLDIINEGRKKIEERKDAPKRERVSRGLSETAGTGEAEPQVLIHALPKPAVRNVPNFAKVREDQTLSKLKTGASRLGGVPDLPPGVQWPAAGGKKLPFVAQFNLAEFPKSVHKILPKDGHLFAFALISNVKKHRPPPVSVFLHRGPATELKRAEAPAPDEIWGDWQGGSVYEVLPATTEPAARSGKKRGGAEEQSLGWLFGEMHGLYGTAGEIADRHFSEGDDWINLIALRSAGSMLWSDSGDLYLLIRRSAFEKLDFSNVIGEACST